MKETTQFLIITIQFILSAGDVLESIGLSSKSLIWGIEEQEKIDGIKILQENNYESILSFDFTRVIGKTLGHLLRIAINDLKTDRYDSEWRKWCEPKDQ